MNFINDNQIMDVHLSIWNSVIAVGDGEFSECEELHQAKPAKQIYYC